MWKAKDQIDLWAFDLLGTCARWFSSLTEPLVVSSTPSQKATFFTFLDIWLRHLYRHLSLGYLHHDKTTNFGVRKNGIFRFVCPPCPPSPPKPQCKTVELPGFRALSMSLSACQQKNLRLLDKETKTFLQTLIYQTKECNRSNSVLLQQIYMYIINIYIYPAIQYFPLSPSQTWSTVASSSGHPGTSLLEGFNELISLAKFKSMRPVSGHSLENKYKTWTKAQENGVWNPSGNIIEFRYAKVIMKKNLRASDCKRFVALLYGQANQISLLASSFMNPFGIDTSPRS